MEAKKLKRRPNFIEACMKYPQITLAITGILALAGIGALLNMPREENPPLPVRQALVISVFPGANEEEVENQVTKKIEQYLFGFKEIKKDETFSTTKEGQVIVNVVLHSWVKDRERFWATLEHGLNNFRPNLPQGVIGPFVNSDFGNTVALMLTVSSSQRSYAEIDKYLDKIEDNVKTLEKTSKIKRFGGQKQQIYISLNNEKLRQYGFDFTRVMQVLQGQNMTSFTGNVDLSESNIPIFADSPFRSEADIANQIIYSNPAGNVVRLKDIATIERRYEDPVSYISMGKDRVMMLTVEMQVGYNIVEFGKELDKRLSQLKTQLPPDIKINPIVSQPHIVESQTNHFFVEFGIAIAAVILVVMILLPFRMATISAIASPISILITFAFLNILGLDINTVTLAAMIICLGMVVDDAIVVVDNYVENLDQGFSPWEAGWRSATQLFTSIFVATFTIIFAFLPLIVTQDGTQGDFIVYLPVTITIALCSSFLVAISLTPYMCYIFIKKGLHSPQAQAANSKPSFLDRVQNVFDKSVNWAFDHHKLTLSLGVVSVLLTGVVGGLVKQEFMPILDRDQFNIEVWMPEGTSLRTTEKAVQKVQAVIGKDERIRDMAAFIGSSSPRFFASYAPEAPRENYAQIFINTTSDEATYELVKEYLPKFENFLPEGEVRLRQVGMSESKAPIEIRVKGENLNDMKKTGEQITAILQKTKGTGFLRNDYRNDYLGVKVNVNEDEATKLGLNQQMIAQTIGGMVKGVPVSTLWEGDTPIGMTVRLDSASRSNFDQIQHIYLSTMTGSKVPLSQVAKLEPSWHTGNIVRRNGIRTLTVLSETQKGLTANQILAKAKPEIEKLTLPPGISIAYDGDEGDMLESAPKMGKSLGISLILVFLLILMQFKNLKKVGIILMTFPLSLLGAMTGLLITGNPMGFTAFLGILSLIGIVVRNGIILVDYADELVAHGHSIREAAIGAAKRRMRPIFLTSAAASVGVLPMIISKSPMWAPLGSVLCVGLMFSMVMTLFIVPILYYMWIKPEKATGNAEVYIMDETQTVPAE
jgi:multidrug efflux pump